ncbi:hypothetical protein AAFF_G00358640 [Aldrovandia affinis]|uniref:Uncharacterized protein n=1 Tax=Aldrovandia affinis TaxID=143900 RepID=A0AAD7X0J6_9TELE|nr:hypothetical protein AAFF_G00358640 [Aldrovandia affinis]
MCKPLQLGTGSLPRSQQRCYDITAGSMRNCAVFMLILGMICPGALPGHQRRRHSESEERMQLFRLSTFYIPRPAPQYFASDMKDTAQAVLHAMRPMAFMMCLLGNTVARPLRTNAKAESRPLLLPPLFLDQTAQQIPQFINWDPINALYEQFPFILNTPQLQFLTPDRQTQILPGFNYLPFPSIIPQQYGVTGHTFFPTTQQTGPLAETDTQAQVYTIIIQHTQAGGSSSEEGGQQSIIINGPMMPVIPGGPNMGIKNEEEEEPTEVAPGPEGILPNPENPEIPNPAHQGNAPPTEVPVSQTESVLGPEVSPIGVQLDANQAGSAAQVRPCDRAQAEVTTPSGQKMPPSTVPLGGTEIPTHPPQPLSARRGNGKKRISTRQLNKTVAGRGDTPVPSNIISGDILTE